MSTKKNSEHPSAEAGATFALLIEGSYRSIYNMAFRLSGSHQDAEDLTQEACYRAYRSMDLFEGNRPFSNWMYRIVTRLYLDQLRTRRRRVREVSFDGATSLQLDLASFDPADSRPTPEIELMNKTFCSTIADALVALTPDQRELILRIDLLDDDPKHIAADMSLPAATLRSRLHRTHRQIRSRILATPAQQLSTEATVKLRSALEPKSPAGGAAVWGDWQSNPISCLASEFQAGQRAVS